MEKKGRSRRRDEAYEDYSFLSLFSSVTSSLLRASVVEVFILPLETEAT
jgi:hypothetical protein